MTHRQTDPTTEAQAAAEELAPALAALDGAALDAISAPTDDVADAPHAAVLIADAGGGIASAARISLRTVRRGATVVVSRIPASLRATRAGVTWTVAALQRLPDSTLRSIAATSVGLGAGLSFTRAGRLATMVGVVPAVVIEAAIANRPPQTAVTEATLE